jgi:serine/threonine protein kinase
LSAHSLNSGRYELDPSPLGHGGMGEVWSARDTKLDREVVVKFIRLPRGVREEDHIRRRFARESRITARLEHPGVPAVYDVGVDGGRPFIVMQRIRGVTVAQLIKEHGRLPTSWAAAIAAQVCAVLAVAHAESLVHRDLKPSNLMVEPHGGVKVLDFGLAVAPSLADASRVTRTGDQLGTPGYMAPEQVEANLSEPATDLYALGCTLHEMLCGLPVFTGDTPFALMVQQVNGAPPPLRGLRPDVPVALERLVLDLLSKKPEDRPSGAEIVYQTLLPFVTALDTLPGTSESSGVGSPTWMYAGVLSRLVPTLPAGPVESTSSTSTKPESDSGDTDPVEPVGITRQDLVRVLDDARRLAEQSRFRQAADALKDVERRARKAFGRSDPDVLTVRHRLAGMLFDGGNYRRAAPIYHALTGDLAGGGPTELWYDCRYKEAVCYASIGRVDEALRQLERLMSDQRRTYGAADPRGFEVRKQIGVLQLRSGMREAATRTLTELSSHLRLTRDGSRQGLADEVTTLLRINGLVVEEQGEADPGWADVARWVEQEPATQELLRGLTVRGLPAPVVGYELGDEAWIAEMAWPHRKIAVLPTIAPGDGQTVRRDAAFEAAGWIARMADGWTVEEIAELLG